MQTKTCRICGIEKPIDEYNKCSGRNCVRTECKLCQSIIYKQYRKRNKFKIDEKHKEYIKKHKKEYQKYAHNNYEKYKEKRREQGKLYREQNKEKLSAYFHTYYIEHKKEIQKSVKEYRNSNKDKLIKKQQEYNNKRRKEDELYKLKINIRNMINRSFARKNYKKSKHTEQIIGCEIGFFINYLLQTFKDNYGYEWDGKEKVHIDHKTPLKKAKTKEEVMQLCYYKNLQLLKAKDNLQKSAKINYRIGGD